MQARGFPNARVERAPAEHARSASRKDGLVAPYPTLPRSLVLSQGWDLTDLPLRASILTFSQFTRKPSRV